MSVAIRATVTEKKGKNKPSAYRWRGQKGVFAHHTQSINNVIICSKHVILESYKNPIGADIFDTYTHLAG